MTEYKLVDVEARHREYPNTFEIPTQTERCSLRTGDEVKLGFDDKERMWVKVQEVSELFSPPVPPRYRGVLLNESVFLFLRLGDPIEFGPEHVMEIGRV